MKTIILTMCGALIFVTLAVCLLRYQNLKQIQVAKEETAKNYARYENLIYRVETLNRRLATVQPARQHHLFTFNSSRRHSVAKKVGCGSFGIEL